VQDANGCTATTSATITEPTQVVISSTPAVDATCNGANNGSISINASGGTIPLQYSINNGSSYQSGSSFSNLSPGTYQIIVQDANGCTATTSVTITEPSAVAFTSTHTDANCGNANGTISLNGSGGTAPLQYSINNGTTFQSTGNFNSLLAGNYQIVVLDANGCSAAGSVSVQNLAAPIINSVSHTDITCNGSDNGSLVINASGGTGSLQYSIDNGNTFNAVASFNNLPPGNYLIVVQDATGCQASSSSIITEPLPLSLTPALTGTTCSNSNGSISVNAGGGTSPYQYSSNNGGSYQSSNNFSNLSSGNYNMVVQDANGCTISQSVTINDAPSPVISSINTSGLTCNNSGDGSIAIVTSAGTAPLQYSIDNGSNYQSSGNFSSLSAGSYQVLVMDANGCTASGNISLTQPSAINLSLSSTASTCGNSDGAVNASASGGTGALQYSIDNGITYQSSSTFNSLLSGNYTVIVQDANGCTASSTVAVNNQSAPVILSTPSTDITCFGANNGTITVNANGGVGSLQYSVDNGNTYLSSSSFNALSPGNYSVVVQDANGCTATSSVVISEPAVIAISTNISGSVCSNANGAISVSASGGTGALQYSINNGNTFQPSGNFANIVSGNYAIVVQDANGCTMTASAVVNDAPAATILNTPVINISCNGLANGQIQINAQGGTSPLQFSVDNGSTYQSSNVFQNLAGGNYQIMVSDANGCTTTAAATISEPAPVNATAASSNANCGQADGSVTVNASGGAGALQYSIDNGVSYQSSSQFGFLTAGNYNIIIQDGNGCTASVSVTVNSNAAPVISAVSSVDITCYGTGNGSVVVTANGGTGSLQYSVDNGLTYQPTNTFNNLTPGIYAVVVMDASGCTVTSQATITEPALLTMTSGTQKSVCGLANGSITINASGGTQPLQFSIDNGSTFQPVNSFTNLNAGSYQLLVQDANGCSASSSVNVASAPSPVISNVAVTPITCSGTNNGAITVTVSGGSNPLQFSIDNGVTFQSSNNFASLTGGNYQVMVTDANGCSVSASATLSQPAPVSISATTGNANCNQADGSVTISASGGTGTLLYSIDHGVSFQSSSFFGFLPAGTYTMFVQDGNGCIDSLDAVVNNNAAPAISSVSNTDVTCNGLNNGSVTVNASGGTGMLQYSIDNGSSYQSSSVFTNVIPGSYAVVVQDGNGCTVTSSAVVTEPALLTFTSNVLGSTCGLANGSITINPSGGTLPYQFSNDNGNTFQSANQFTGLTGGSYQLLISDANGCTATSVKNVGTAPSPVINSVAHTDLSCNGSNNGTLTVSVSNGTAPLQFSSDNGITYQSNGSFTNLQAGSYQVIVQDANGCTATSGTVLTEPQAITVNTTSTDASCGSSNGTLTVVAGGGSGVLLYSVDGGVSYFSDSLFLNLLAGNYNVVVQDANGCTSTVAASVLNTSSPVLSSSPVTNVSCFGYNDGTITVNITGGSGTLTYSINGGITTQTSNVFSSLQAGNYTVIVNDAQGCSISTSVSITEPDEIIVNTATTDATCGATNGSITVNANGGAGALQYSINNGTTFQPNGNFANQGAGNYQIVVQDANGCVANDVASVSNTNAPTISSVTYTSLTCNGSNDGTINVNAAGGTGALQYSINNGQTYSAASSFNNLLQGNYAIIVLDAAGCQTTYNVLLTEPSPILFNTAITPSTCGNSNGVITFNAIGGTAPLTYSIDNGASFQSSVQFNGLNASNYGVVVQDNNGCSVNAQAVIPNQGGPAIQNIVAADVKCYGLSNGSVTVSATGGTGALQYSINNGSSFQSGNYFNNLPQANYQIVVQDANGCTATASSVIQQPAALTINAVAGGATCSNANGVINVTAAGGTGTISYSADSGITYQALSQFASVLAGNYNMVVQDSNGCKAYMAINVTDAPAPVLPPCTVSNVSCYGMSNGSITISAVGGTAPLSYSVNNGLTYQSAVLFNNLSAGNYDVVVQDANGCTVSSTEQIIQPSQINFILNASAATCGNSNGTINVISSSGGTGLYQFSIDSGLIWQSSVVFDSLGASSYSVMMQDANGCTASHVVVVPDIGGPVISNLAVTDVQCHGGNNGTIAVSQSNGTGPFQFSINNGQSYQSGNLFSGLTVGTYTMIVTDVNGCSASAPALIAEPDALVVSTSTNGAVCSNPNGSITIVASGGTGSLQYSSDNGITYQPQAGFSAVAAGTYNLIVQDANGCTVAQTVTVSDAPSPLIDSVIVSNVKCFNGNDGEVTLQTSGGTAPLTYSINGGTAQAFAQFANLSAGNYSLMVTDSNGCTQSAAASVSHPAKLNFALSAQPSTCGNNNGQLAVINLSGGTGSYSFSADSGATFQSSSQFINLASGSYQIMVMDSNGCTKVNTINVTNLPGPVFGALSLTDINCFGNTTGNIGITPQGGTGPFHFSIDGGQTSQGGNVFNNLAAGNYSLSIIDNNGCQTDSIIILSEPPVLTYSITSSVATCGNSNASLTLAGSGGAGNYQYSINGGMTYQSSGVFAGLTPNAYPIVVIDLNNCSIADSINIASAPAPVLALTSSTNISCYNLSDGSVAVSASAGTSPFTYSIDQGNNWQSNAVFNSLPYGSYWVYVQDANGCQDSVSINLNQPPQLITQTTASAVVCNGGNSGSAAVTATGGTAPYSYNWNISGSTASSLQNVTAGTYTVVVTDANNCSQTDSVVVSQPALLQLSVTPDDATCFGFTDGAVTVSVNGGTSGYQYSIDGVNYQSSTVFNSLAPNSYSITVMDANGCTATATTTISQPQQIAVTSQITPVQCFGGTNGAIGLSAAGGKGNYVYAINGGVGQALGLFNNLPAGTYSILITDANGCTLSFSDSITQPDLLTTTSQVQNVLCNGQSNGAVTVAVAGGVAPYSYNWNTGDTLAAISNMPQGSYTVVVTDNNGCTTQLSATVSQPTAINVSVSPDPTICIGQQATLTASASGGTAPYVFKWNTGYVGAVLNVSPAVTTPYNVFITDNAGCNSPLRYANVFVNPPLDIIVSPDDTICQGQSVTLTANVSGGNGGPYNITWDGQLQSSLSVSPSATTVYTAMVSDGCTVMPAQAQSTVVVNPLPQVNFAPLNAEGCAPLTVSFDNLSVNAVSYQWTFGDGEKDTIASAVHTYETPGIYSVGLFAVSNEGCENNMVLDDLISVYDNPIAAFDINRTETIILDPRFEFYNHSIGASHYQWNFGDNKGVSSEPNPFYAYSDTGIFNIILVASNEHECADTAYGEVHVGGAFTVYIPNAFSPNNDGRNDYFGVNGIGYTSVQMLIFDRWGNLIFNQTSENPQWEGINMFNSTQCQQGVYVYKVIVKSIFDKQEEYKGTVTLIR
jgi:gliding motility-associated-like protein